MVSTSTVWVLTTNCISSCSSLFVVFVILQINFICRLFNNTFSGIEEIMQVKITKLNAQEDDGDDDAVYCPKNQTIISFKTSSINMSSDSQVCDDGKRQ